MVSGGGEDSAGSLSDDRVLNRYRYDAFGTTVSCEETVENCFRYTGGQYDPMTEQYYLKARFYNPAVARFTQEDTYYGDGLNLYAYCHSNPVSYVDSTGHEAKAAAETNFIEKGADAANKYIDKGTDAMLHQVYESGSKTINDGLGDLDWTNTNRKVHIRIMVFRKASEIYLTRIL